MVYTNLIFAAVALHHMVYTNLIFAAVALHHSTIANGSPSTSQEKCLVDCVLEEQYCSGNSCLDHTRCMEDADCLNKSNLWMQPMCVGTVTCSMSDVEGEPGYCNKSCDTMCNADNECGKGQYCADGVCLDHMTCRGDKDCLQPSNIWYEDECIGSITCENGSCGKICDMYCENDKDCGEQQYCAGDVCLDHATCRGDKDCLQPSNNWFDPMCEGSVTCDDGSCSKTCHDGTVKTDILPTTSGETGNTNILSTSEDEDNTTLEDHSPLENLSESGATDTRFHSTNWNKLLVATICLSFHHFV